MTRYIYTLNFTTQLSSKYYVLQDEEPVLHRHSNPSAGVSGSFDSSLDDILDRDVNPERIFLFTTITLLGLLTPAGVSLAVRDTPTTSTQDPPQVQDTLADISLDVPLATPTCDLPPVQDTPTGVSPSLSLSSQRRIVREQGVSWNDSQFPPG